MLQDNFDKITLYAMVIAFLFMHCSSILFCLLSIRKSPSLSINPFQRSKTRQKQKNLFAQHDSWTRFEPNSFRQITNIKLLVYLFILRSLQDKSFNHCSVNRSPIICCLLLHQSILDKIVSFLFRLLSLLLFTHFNWIKYSFCVILLLFFRSRGFILDENIHL